MKIFYPELKATISILLLILFIPSCNPFKDGADTSFLFPYHAPAEKKMGRYKFRYGYMDKSGDKVIMNQFIQADPFTEGLGCVAIESGNKILYGYIDSSAAFVIPARFKKARPFHNGRALVWEHDTVGWGVINKKGEFITEKIYTVHTTDFENGHCIAYTKSSMQKLSRGGGFRLFGGGGFRLFGSRRRGSGSPEAYYDCYRIDLDGKSTLVESYTQQTDHGNYIRLRRQNDLAVYWTPQNQYGYKKISLEDFGQGSNYINHGQVFLSPEYRHAENFVYGYAQVTFSNGDKGYIDTTGAVVVRYAEEQQTRRRRRF
jgi:hypothetical protein